MESTKCIISNTNQKLVGTTLTQILSSPNITSENTFELKLKKLYSKYNILSKDFLDFNLAILYNKYDNRNKTKLEMECRSIIINRTTLDIISYSCHTPLYNTMALNYMHHNPSYKKQIYTCYEGSMLSIFNYNNNWYVSSRTHLYNNQSEINNKNQHYKMFLEVIKQDGHDSMDSFVKLLDVNKSYNFVLIHHLNENIVDYTSRFGEQYMKLCFIFARDMTTMYEVEVDTSFLSTNIFIVEKLNNIMLEDNDYMDKPTSEGIVIKMNNMVLKLQNISYQFNKAIGMDKNMYRGFMHLYQLSALKHFFQTNNNVDKFKNIVNPLNTKESYDIIGMIDAVFKVCTSELLYLFNIIYNTDGSKKPNTTSLYTKLPEEYKNILFNIRGLLFSIIKRKSADKLELKDIYNLLKSYDIIRFESLIRCRKLMLNWIKLEKSELVNLFVSSLYHSDKILYTLSSIYSIKLFPEIMSDNTPWSRQSTDNSYSKKINDNNINV